MSTDQRVMELLREAKTLAREYYALTGKPVGVTGEVAEYEAHGDVEGVFIHKGHSQSWKRRRFRRSRIDNIAAPTSPASSC